MAATLISEKVSCEKKPFLSQKLVSCSTSTFSSLPSSISSFNALELHISVCLSSFVHMGSLFPSYNMSLLCITKMIKKIYIYTISHNSRRLLFCHLPFPLAQCWHTFLFSLLSFVNPPSSLLTHPTVNSKALLSFSLLFICYRKFNITYTDAEIYTGTMHVKLL